MIKKISVFLIALWTPASTISFDSANVVQVKDPLALKCHYNPFVASGPHTPIFNSFSITYDEGLFHEEETLYFEKGPQFHKPNVLPAHVRGALNETEIHWLGREASRSEMRLKARTRVCEKTRVYAQGRRLLVDRNNGMIKIL